MISMRVPGLRPIEDISEIMFQIFLNRSIISHVIEQKGETYSFGVVQ